MEETLSTLKFAARMQSVTNMAAINTQAEVSPAAALAQAQAQINDLKKELAMHDQLAGRGHISYDPYTPTQRTELRGRVQLFLDGDVPELEATTLRGIKESFDIFRTIFKEQQNALEQATAHAQVARQQAAAVAASGGGGGGGGGGIEVAGEIEVQPPVEVVDFVGDAIEGAGATSGFGCGVAPADSKPAADFMKPASYVPPPVDSRAAMLGAPAASGALSPDGLGGGSGDASKFFAEFKSGAGYEVAGLLRENKTTLRERRADVRRVALEVNAAKREIDNMTDKLEQLKASKESNVQVVNGRPTEVIDDEEFAMISQLKAAKASYRTAYDQLAEERGNVEYTNTIVENCRAQLPIGLLGVDGGRASRSAASAAVLAAAAAGEGNNAKGGGGGRTPRADALSQPSYGGASSIYGGMSGYGAVSGLGMGSGFGGGGSLVLGGKGGGAMMSSAELPPPGTAASFDDQDDRFEKMEQQLALERDPDSLAFFNASKLANARNRKQPKGASVRAPKGAPAFNP